MQPHAKQLDISGGSEKSGHLGYDAMLLGEWFLNVQWEHTTIIFKESKRNFLDCLKMYVCLAKALRPIHLTAVHPIPDDLNSQFHITHTPSQRNSHANWDGKSDAHRRRA